MIEKEKINQWKKDGRIIISSATFKKSVNINFNNHEFPFEYKGKNYRSHDWLLTYGHEQYQELIP